MLFDDVEDPEGREVSSALLRRALAATDTAPKLLLLNACDTLDDATPCSTPSRRSSP